MFVYYYIKTSKMQREIANKTNGAALQQINVGDLKNLSIPLPPLSVQQSIVEKLDACEELIQNLREERDLRQKQYEFYREQLLRF